MIYTANQKFLNSKMFYVFIFCSPSLRLFDPKYSKKKFFYYLF